MLRGSLLLFKQLECTPMLLYNSYNVKMQNSHLDFLKLVLLYDRPDVDTKFKTELTLNYELLNDINFCGCIHG